MGLYEQIKEVATAKGYSINRLEKELGFPRSSISKYNKNILHVSIADITGEEKEGGEKYYLNEETAEMAQKLFENNDLRVLFDAAKDATPEDLKTTYDMLMALKKKERDNNEFWLSNFFHGRNDR